MSSAKILKNFFPILGNLGKCIALFIFLFICIFTIKQCYSAVYKKGPLLTPDSHKYVASMLSFIKYSEYLSAVDKETLKTSELPNVEELLEECIVKDGSKGKPAYWHAPGYPFTVALICKILHCSVRVGLFLCHILCVIILLSVIFLFLRKYPWQLRIIQLSCLSLLLAIYERIILFAWSEVLFLPILLIYFFIFKIFLKNVSISKNNNISYFFILIILSCLSSFAILTRYVGIYILPLTMIWVMLDKRLSLKQKMQGLGIYILVPFVSCVLLAYRSYSMMGTLQRKNGLFESFSARLLYLSDRLVEMSDYFLNFFPNPRSFSFYASVIFSFIMILLWVLFLYFERKQFIRTVDLTHCVILSFSLGYLLFIFMTTLNSGEPWPYDFRTLCEFTIPFLFF